MDYLHMQLPIGGIWNNVSMTGVPVILTAFDSNGNTQNIGTATTNAYTGAFSYTFTPPIEGDYTIMATFAGDESYGSSGASTAIYVGLAPTAAPTAPPAKEPIDHTWTIVGMGIAIIVAVIIATILLLMKRK
jgi:hypothetical protein